MNKLKLQKELDNVANSAMQPIVKGCIVKAKYCRLYDISGDFLVDCGTSSRANRAQKLLQEGKISFDIVMMVFGDTDDKKSRTANKVELSDFDWDDVPVDGGKK